MNTITNVATTQQHEWVLPKSAEAALKLAQTIAKTELCPQEYQNKPQKALIAMQMGAELGFSPLQALQGIAVINGRPAVWGDSLKAICLAHPDCLGISDEVTNDAATVIVRRNFKGNITEVKRTFTKEDAIRAGLWDTREKITPKGKNYKMDNPSPWYKYPQRMLYARALGFALRDAFPDSLRGIVTREEARNLVIKDVTGHTVVTKKQAIGKKLGIPGVQHESAQEVAAEPENEAQGVISEAVTKKANILEKIIEENHLQELRIKWLNKKGVGCFEEFAEHELDACIERVGEVVEERAELANEFDKKLQSATRDMPTTNGGY